MQHIFFSIKNVKDNRTKNQRMLYFILIWFALTKYIVYYILLGFLIVLIISLKSPFQEFFMWSKIALHFFMIETLYSKSDKELRNNHA